VGDVAPVQLAGVHHDIELVAMESVLPAEQDVHENIDERDGAQNDEIAGEGASFGCVWMRWGSWWPLLLLKMLRGTIATDQYAAEAIRLRHGS